MHDKVGDEYLFLRRPSNDEKIPSLKADDDTSMRDYADEFEELAAPLIFENSWKEDLLKKKVRESIGPILFDGNDVLVNGKIRNALLQKDFPYLQMKPAVYIDIRDKWHEDYWFLTFAKHFDCWDRKSSTFTEPPIRLGGEEIYGVHQFSLNEAVVRDTPLAERLLFKMGGSLDAFVTVHRSLISILQSSGNTGFELQKLTDYGRS